MLSDSDRRWVWQWARAAVAAAVAGRPAPEVDPAAVPAALRQPAAAFITLRRAGELRGCIGGLEARWPLYVDVGQHAAQARYRAIEEGLPMARVASRGETGMIDAYGRWSARGAPADPAKFGPDPEGWRSSVVDARIPAAIAATPYSNWRDGLFWIILFGLNLGLFVLPRR